MFRGLKSACFAAMLVTGLSGCAQHQLDQFNRDLANLNAALGAAPVGGPAQLAQKPALQSAQTQLVVPADRQVAAALDSALPTIKKVVAIHQCVRSGDGMRLLNSYAVPGRDFSGHDSWGGLTVPYSQAYPLYGMQYHDKNRCASVRAIDEVTQPALNALRFRVVYFAEDSGETRNHQMQLRKLDDGTWQLSQIA